jgi:hypothetical protein
VHFYCNFRGGNWGALAAWRAAVGGGEAMSVNERFCEAKTKVLNVPL